MTLLRAFSGFTLLLSLGFAAAVSALRMQPYDDLTRSTAADCAAPCWHVFQPGVTTDDDAFVLFERLGWTLDTRYCQRVNVCSVFGWRAPEPAGQKAGSIFVAGRLGVIAFSKPRSTLGDLLLMRGTPAHIDQYMAFDTTGREFTVYRAYWDSLDVQVRVDCPTTFAELLRQPAAVVTLSISPYREDSVLGAKPPILSHSFRKLC
jgi:hypothetical protein